MTKLEQLNAYLASYAAAYRTKNSLGDETIALKFLANNKVITIWCGQTDPADQLKIDHLWYNGQVLKHCVGIQPNEYKVVTTYFSDAPNGYGYFTTQIVPLGEDFGRVTLADVSIIGPDKLEPSSPTGNQGKYLLRLTRSDGGTIDVKPTWSLTDNAPVTYQRSGKELILTAQPIDSDTRLQLTARYQDPDFGAVTTVKDILVVGAKPVQIEQIEIIGPDSVNSNASNVRYTLRVHFSDGTYKDDFVPANWSISNRSAARFASGSRSDVGSHTLVNMLNHAYDMTFTLEATYIVNCTERKIARKDITIKANSGMQNNDIFPYYGKGPAGMISPEFILGLSGRGEYARRQNTFELELCEGEYGYYAYPVRYGKGTFVNLDNNFTGGWEGSPDAVAGDIFEPLVVQVPVGSGVEPFYLYATDYGGLGILRTEVK